ncbi:MAG TPA: NAD(P)/FAD-dependent oxidoreductase [Candidatus Xenobia bacterium]|jgi:kynurenine 3-monooxygenase
MKPFHIVGAGLAGSLLAVYFGRQGWDVDLYERRPDMRVGAVPRGRSINLALSVRGLSALDEVGLQEAVLEQAIPMQGRMIHDEQGRETLQPYSIHPYEAIRSVSRHALNVLLLDAAEKTGHVRTHFEHRLSDLHRTLRFETPSGPREILAAGPVIGADGVHSAVRHHLERMDRFSFSQVYLDWGYKELTIPAGPGGHHLLFTHALHIWPRHNFMLIALPNLDGSFTCTLFLPWEGRHSFAALDSDRAVKTFFERFFPDALPHLPDLADDFRHNPTSPLAWCQCAPWHQEGDVVLVGDACHAVVPFYGQGMNAAFEDCSVLFSALQNASNVRAAFRHYQFQRKRNTDALSELSLKNFEEMRDHVVSKKYLAKKKAENMLHRLFPDQFIPLYSMVTFSRMPYADALERSRRQDRLLAGLGVGATAALAALGLTAATSAFSRQRQTRLKAEGFDD